MLKKLALASMFGLALSTSPLVLAQDFTPKFAVMNLELVMFEIPQSKEIQTNMEKLFGARQQELVAMQKEAETLYMDLQTGKLVGDKANEAKRKLALLQSDIQIKGQALQEESRKKAQEEQTRVLKLVDEQIQKIAKEKGIDIVLQRDAIGFLSTKANESINITQDIIDGLKAQAKGTTKSTK